MSKDKERRTMIYMGFGFPIRLINAPMRKIYGDWVFDFSMGLFQEAVLHILVTKPTLLTGQELRFIIDYLGLSYRGFAKLLGISHAAVVKWEKNKSRMNLHTEISLRLYILNYLKVSDHEFREQYLNLSQQNLFNTGNEDTPLDIDLNKIAC